MKRGEKRRTQRTELGVEAVGGVSHLWTPCFFNKRGGDRRWGQEGRKRKERGPRRVPRTDRTLGANGTDVSCSESWYHLSAPAPAPPSSIAASEAKAVELAQLQAFTSNSCSKKKLGPRVMIAKGINNKQANPSFIITFSYRFICVHRYNLIQETII